jgi:hypothetical protein
VTLFEEQVWKNAFLILLILQAITEKTKGGIANSGRYIFFCKKQKE